MTKRTSRVRELVCIEVPTKNFMENKEQSQENKNNFSGENPIIAEQNKTGSLDNFDLNRPWLSLDPWQQEYIATPPEVDCFVMTPRQIGGKTTAMSIKAVELCVNHYKEGEIVLINSLTEKQAMLMLKKAQIYAEAKYPKLICRDKENRPTMHRLLFKDGKLNKGILCYAAGEEGESTRGYTIKKLMIDEGSRMKELYFVAALPTLSVTKGSIDISSTPFGKKDKEGNEKFFYKCYKDDSFKKFLVNIEDCPRRDLEQIEKMRKRMTENQFKQEFLAMFIDELYQFFSDEWIEKVCCLKKEGRIISRGEKNYLGVDVGGFGKDVSAFVEVGKLLNKEIEQREGLKEPHNKTTETTNRAIELDDKFKNIKIGVDDGGIGFGVFCELLDNPKTKRKTIALNNASRDKERDLETGEMKEKKLLKEEMYVNLKMLGEQKRLKLFNDDELRASLASIQYEGDKIFGSDSHYTEATMRACWLAEKDKSLNIFINSF